MNKPIVLLLLFIGLTGLYLRFNTFRVNHPDNDDLYELQQINGNRDFLRVLSNKQNYGDHTSFPGEMIMFQFIRGIFDWSSVKFSSPVESKSGKWEVVGTGLFGFWKMAWPRIVLCISGMILMGFLCYEYGAGGVAGYAVYCFNPHLVYHAFSIRPYSVLAVMGVLSIWLSKRRAVDVVHFLFFIFACIYHAYGPMIAIIPLWFCRRKSWFWLSVPAGLAMWSYYASYNTFGVTANSVQAVVVPGQYFKLTGLNYVQSLMGNGILFYIFVPVLGLMLLRGVRVLKFFGMVVLPIALISLVDLKTGYWILPRQWIWVMPWFCLWVGEMVDGMMVWVKEVSYGKTFES